MKNRDKTREQLVSENEELRRRVAALEKALPENQSATALLQIAPLGIHECDTEGRITFVNPSQQAITGYTANELVGTYVWDHIEPGPEKDSLPAYFKHLVSEQPVPTPFFAKNIRKSGEVVDVRVDWNYKRNQQGQITGFVSIVSDITEQKRAEEALQESEERYRLLAEAIPHPVWRSDAEGRQIDCNCRWQEYTGQTPEEAQGNGWMKALHPDDVAWAVQRVREDVPGGNIYQAEYRLHRASDDTYHWYLARAIPWRDADGTILGWFGSAVDIDDQKRTEEALRQSEVRLRRFYESGLLGVIYWKMNGQVIDANDRFLEMVGYQRADLVAGRLDWVNMTPPEYRHLDARSVEELKTTGVNKVPFEKEYVRKDGTRVPIIVAGAMLDEARLDGVAFVLDITERKRAEEALRQSEERFQQAMEATNDGLWDWNVKSGDVYYSPAYSRMLGYEAAEFANHVQSWIDLLHPDDRAKAVSVNQDCIENRIPNFEVEFRMRTKGGEWKTILGRGKAVCRDADGRAIRMIGTHLDITERKRAEEALQKAHDELETKVQERTAELAKANEELAIFQKFAEASGQGFSMADLDGHLIYLNPALCRMLGEERPEDRIGQHLSIYYSEESNRRGKQEIEPALKQRGNWQGELPMLSRGGKSVPTWQNSFMIRDENGKSVCMAVVVTDITERKQAEEALRQSERRFRNYFEQGLIGMAVTSVDKRWLEVNDRLCEILGYRREELVQTNWAALTHPDDVEPNLRLFNPLLAGEIEHFTLNKRYLKKDGSIVYTTIHTRAFRKDDGTIDHIVTLIEDITARKQAEEALDRERQSLWRMLQAGDHERQTISYEIHDGLAQYLAAAIMQFQARDTLRENSPKEAKKAYKTAMELVRQAHSESRRLISEVRPPVIDEDGIETAISHLVHEQRRHGGPTIKFDSDVQFGRLPSILENAIYRIVQEALTNACKHSKSKKVTVSMIQEGQDVRLEVRDWGIGFHPESVEEGHFGLESIRQRVRLLGGRLAIETAPGSGTLIRVVVPILERQHDG